MGKITNLAKIAEAHALFEDGNLNDCDKTLKRITNNFQIEHDEYVFTGLFELYQPTKELAEKLIDEGKPELVGDNDYLADKAYLKYAIKTVVYVESTDPYDVIDDEDDDAWGPDSQLPYSEPIKLYYHASYRMDGQGICSSTGNGGKKTKHMREEVKTVITKWLKQEFGKVNEW